MRKKNVEEFLKEAEKDLEKVQKEYRKISKMGAKATAFEGEQLKNLYLKEQFIEGQIFAAKYIINNC